MSDHDMPEVPGSEPSNVSDQTPHDGEATVSGGSAILAEDTQATVTQPTEIQDPQQQAEVVIFQGFLANGTLAPQPTQEDPHFEDDAVVEAGTPGLIPGVQNYTNTTDPTASPSTYAASSQRTSRRSSPAPSNDARPASLSDPDTENGTKKIDT
ncbi:hypothetical protein M231_05909 [Tremella mesenterica]|uniref:Uncharacterized protein n=1 Tax=Tremella mesenterica TaxID=5217 RepID=A0A4Q1BGY0_TREME|nr:hypothetical protein M231_05909 [Tremella mesenterica]